MFVSPINQFWFYDDFPFFGALVGAFFNSLHKPN